MHIFNTRNQIIIYIIILLLLYIFTFSLPALTDSMIRNYYHNTQPKGKSILVYKSFLTKSLWIEKMHTKILEIIGDM